MSERQAWPGQPYLDDLRPERGASVRLAIFATYSVDVSAVAASLLALIGCNDDRGSGSAVDFAQAVDALRDKVRILVQRGRIVRPARLPKIAGLLDQFVVEQIHDERYSSWHPKIALVAYDGPGDRTLWKLWIGSRNLTRSQDLDAGVLLTGGLKRGRGKVRLAGVGAVGRSLATTAGRVDADAVAEELDRVWWEAPSGYALRGLIDGLEDGVELPDAPPAGPIDAVTIVSPFLSPGFVRRAGTWGPDGHRTLVSSMPSLVKLATSAPAALDGFSRILAYAAPQEAPDDVDPDEAQDEAPQDDDAEPAPPSLHAKIYSFAMGDTDIVRVGSANATDRAWSGRNAEIMVELCGGQAYRRGLEFLVGSAIPVVVADLAGASAPDTRAADALEQSRRQLVSAWTPVLLRDGDDFTLDAGLVPTLAHPTHRLEAGLANGDRLPWPIGDRRLALGRIPLSHQSAFVQLRLVAPDGELSWMQCVGVEPPIEPGRDHAALARHMGLRAFHDWMRAMLGGDPLPSGGSAWDALEGAVAARPAGRGFDRLSLEDILSAWAKDRQAFARADRHFTPYVDALLAHGQDLGPADRADLSELALIWTMARERLTR